MAGKRRVFGPAFKAKVALAAAKGDRDGRINLAARHWRGQDTRLVTCVSSLRDTLRAV
jgi:hypothetical protein